MIAEAVQLAATIRSQHCPIVLVTGCFDLVHRGHVDLLVFARRHGQVFVGINSDAAVTALKGANRPINSQDDRATVLREFRSVLHVFVIDSLRVDGAIRDMAPDYWCKGAEYSLDTLDRSEVFAANQVGSKIIFAPKVEGVSTTRMIERMRQG